MLVCALRSYRMLSSPDAGWRDDLYTLTFIVPALLEKLRPCITPFSFLLILPNLNPREEVLCR